MFSSTNKFVRKSNINIQTIKKYIQMEQNMNDKYPVAAYNKTNITSIRLISHATKYIQLNNMLLALDPIKIDITNNK